MYMMRASAISLRRTCGAPAPLIALCRRSGELARVEPPAIQQLARRVPLLRQQGKPLLASADRLLAGGLAELEIRIPCPQHQTSRKPVRSGFWCVKC